MNEAEIRALVLRELHAIAPEVPPERMRAAEDLREQLDLDSMDVVNLLAALEQKLGIRIDQADHGQLTTLDDAIAYLARSTTRVDGNER